MYSSALDCHANAAFQQRLANLYGDDPRVLRTQADRYARLAGLAAAKGLKEVALFSTPGRTELGGNHTDHSQGKVLAAAIDLDAVAAVSPRLDQRIHLVADGQAAIDLSLDDLTARRSERGTSAALLRGIAARLKTLGYGIGGFDAFISTEELGGSELNSTGVLDALMVSIFNNLFNDGALTVTLQALVGQFAENRYFGKPCGLMDQITCAAGGVVALDFRIPEAPVIDQLDVDLTRFGARLVVVDTGGNGADLTEDYSTIAYEMKVVAAALGRESCRDLDEATLMAQIPAFRAVVGDRAILRTLHYLGENARVDAQVAALREGRFPAFLALVRESGLSSFQWLQNIISPQHMERQGVALALALTERFLAQNGPGACRVHGAGFVGTIQAWVPEGAVEAYRATLEPVFGPGSVKALRIRATGAVTL